MTGIFGVINKKEKEFRKYTIFSEKETKEKLVGRIECQRAFFERNVVNKFQNDKCFFKNEKIIIILDGVILNLKILLEKYHLRKICDLLYALYREYGETFFSKLRGNFCGCLLDLKNDKCIIFTDHLGNYPVYYCELNDELIFSTNIKKIVSYCEEYKTMSLNLAGAYSLLTYAYMYDNLTICDNIFRLRPGNYLVYNKIGLQERCYYKLNFTPKEIDEDLAIRRIDSLFLKAVERQINKNEEYGYYNYAPLSAGLDSRMTVYALKRLRAKNVVNFTYSESNELDQIIPMKITKELKNKWIFKNLDGGLDLLNIENSIELGDSKIYYPWISQLNDFMNLIDKNNLGIVHTGVIGDVVLGTYLKSFNDIKNSWKYTIGDGGYSSRLVEKIKKFELANPYNSYEEGMFYNRVFNGVCLGYSIVFQEFSDCMSPFMDLEFLEFCLSLPIEYRFQHNLYYKWINKCYPNATRYSHNGLKITSGKSYFNIKGKRIYLDTVCSRILLLIRKGKRGMNPMQYWYNSNPDLQNKMDSYFKEKSICLSKEQELYKDLFSLYKNGTAIEKTMCISLVGYVSSFWGDKNR